MTNITGPVSAISRLTHAEKYRADNESFEEFTYRIANSLKDNDQHYHSLINIIGNQYFLPAGRVQSAMGSPKKVTAFNCFVSMTIEDSSHSIMKALSEAFKAEAGRDGYQIIYDTVGGDYSEPAVRSIGWAGRFLVVGFPAGIAKLPLNLTLLKSCDVCGVFWGAFAARDPKGNRANIAELFDLYEAGKIKPVISATYPLERGGEAIAMLGNREATGKLVVTV